MLRVNKVSNLIFLSLCLFMISCQPNSSVEGKKVEGTEAIKSDAKAHPATSANNQSKKKVEEENESHMNVGGMKWMTMEEAGSLDNEEGKKFLVDVYTDWCGWCKVMDKNTFTDPGVKAYLEDHFHLVKFNAEQKEPIKFKGQTYEWMPAGRKGVNKLAMEIMGGRMSYPTLVFFDENMQKISVNPGYKKPLQLLEELKLLENS